MSNRSLVKKRTLCLLATFGLIFLSTIATAEERTEAVWGAEDLEAEEEPRRENRSRFDELPQVVGRVIEVRSGVALIDLGREHGLREGMKIELYRVQTVSLGSEEVEREELIAIETVSLLAEQFSEVDLSLNISVEEGVRARPTANTNPLFRNPPAVRNTTIGKLTLRPILLGESSGVGMLVDASVGLRFSSPLTVDFRLQPLGFTLSDRDDVLNFGGNILVSYAWDLFQIGLGAGLVNSLTALGPDFVEGEAPYTGVGFDTILHARFGATEGTHLGVSAHFMVHEGGVALGGAALEGQRYSRWIRRNDFWVTGRVEGSAAGYFLAEVGMRALVFGNGGPGSLFLSPSFGLGGIIDSRYEACTQLLGDGPNQRTAAGFCRRETFYSGLMFGIGGEWRN